MKDFPHILTLPIKKKWFDMLKNGEKLEEYRDPSPYNLRLFFNENDEFKPYLVIRFTNGYGYNVPYFWAKINNLSIGYGNAKWGASGELQIIISVDPFPSFQWISNWSIYADFNTRHVTNALTVNPSLGEDMWWYGFEGNPIGETKGLAKAKQTIEAHKIMDLMGIEHTYTL